ncbi:MAG: helix-hairpin-helix domain-containing protein, partial [Caldilinea sp.]
MTRQGTFLTSQQSPIQLGKELGSGGEGKVYEIVGDSSLVAKIYHAPIAAEKQQKLKAMVAAQSGTLAKVTIWPKDVLYESINGLMSGIIMPRLHDYKDLSELYIPANRKKAFPNADWKFLIWTARNMAAAVAEIHQAGHVVGDINPKNLVVISDTTVRLIDCDSFQISANGRTFLCEVGVPHLTAPELQGKSFRGLTRTPNHDNFALAVLCFQLLFLGRHPFAGTPRRSPHDIHLKDAISNYYYAFSEQTVDKVTDPPPNTLQITSIPLKLREMFEAAFGRQGAIGSRPTAQEWTRELELLNKELIGCSVFLSHAYYRTLTQCPWCAIEQAAGIILFPGNLKHPTLQFDLADLWQIIQGISSPQPLPQPSYSSPVYPHALPDAILKAELQKWPWSRHPIDALVAQRKAEFNRAKADLFRTKNQWKAANNAQDFQTKLRELEDLKRKYQALHRQCVDEKRKLEHNARDLQLHEYLDNQHINRANIPGIGPARRASLISFGVETAADVDEAVISCIPGFGPKLTCELVEWRRQFERRFSFDPARGILRADLAKLEHRYAGQLRVLEQKLLAGPKELRDISQRLIAERQVLSSHVEQKTQSLAQVEADYNAAVMAQRRIGRLHTRWTVGTFTSALAVVVLFASVQVALVGDLTILRTVLPGSLGIVQMLQSTQTSAPSVSNTKVPDVLAMTTEDLRLPTATPAKPAATATPAKPAATATPAKPAATATPAKPAATATPAK